MLRLQVTIFFSKSALKSLIKSNQRLQLELDIFHSIFVIFEGEIGSPLTEMTLIIFFFNMLISISRLSLFQTRAKHTRK